MKRKVTIRYNPSVHRSVDLRTFDPVRYGDGIIAGCSGDFEFETSDPYTAEAVEIVAKYLGLEVRFSDGRGGETDQSGFYRTFARPMRSLDLTRAAVDEWIGKGRPEEDNPFWSDDD